jgi:hypothetical protein
LFLALVALSLASNAWALTPEFGVIGGMKPRQAQHRGPRPRRAADRVAAGGAFDLGLNDRFGVRIEPSFLSRGGKATQRNAYWGSVDGALFQLDYFAVPVLARYNLTAESIHPYVLGGLGFNFATSQKAKLTAARITRRSTGRCLQPIRSHARPGLGYNFPAASNRLTFDARVAIGLLNINDGGTVTFNGSPLPVPDTSTHTLDFRLFATYFFPWSGGGSD